MEKRAAVDRTTLKHLEDSEKKDRYGTNKRSCNSSQKESYSLKQPYGSQSEGRSD